MQNEPTCLTSSHSAFCILHSAFEKAPSLERNPTTPIVLGLLRPKSGALHQGRMGNYHALPAEATPLALLNPGFL